MAFQFEGRSEAQDIVDHDCAGRELDAPESTDHLVIGTVDVSPGRVGGVTPQARPRSGKREQQVEGLVVVESLQHCRTGLDECCRELFGVDRGSVVEFDAQAAPGRWTHRWSGGFVERPTRLVN